MFAWPTAPLTAYLPIAFLPGLPTRLACIVGGAASILFPLTQFLTTLTFPGGPTSVRIPSICSSTLFFSPEKPAGTLRSTIGSERAAPRGPKGHPLALRTLAVVGRVPAAKRTGSFSRLGFLLQGSGVSRLRDVRSSAQDHSFIRSAGVRLPWTRARPSPPAGTRRGMRRARRRGPPTDSASSRLDLGVIFAPPYSPGGDRSMGVQNLDRILNPQSIAVIGASDKEGSVGYALARNLVQGGFQGGIHLVALRAEKILGLPTYSSIRDVPGPIDLALIATPAASVPEVVRECGEARVKGAVIVSAGFKETGAAGKALEEVVLGIARDYGVRVVGPNCLGLVRPRMNLNATFLDTTPKPGNVAFISQSGALGSAILDAAVEENVGFSAFISVGSMVDVNFGDLIDYFGSDPYTRSILMYIEGVADARAFMSAARHFARTKPIIVVKAGRYRESARAVASHTGSLSGEDDIYEAAFKRAGVVRVDEISDLFNVAEVLSAQPPLPKGPRLAIITNAGGPGIMATDSLIGRGGTLAELSPATFETLNAALPAFWSRGIRSTCSVTRGRTGIGSPWPPASRTTRSMGSSSCIPPKPSRLLSRSRRRSSRSSRARPTRRRRSSSPSSGGRGSKRRTNFSRRIACPPSRRRSRPPRPLLR